MAAYFFRISTSEVYDYFQLKAQPEFLPPNGTPGWPSDGMNPGIDGLIEPFGLARLIDTEPPVSEEWEIVYKDTPEWKLDSGVYSWNWAIRDMTQTELDELNAGLRMETRFQRQARYAEEADHLFFMAQRNETTMQEWLDKIEEIRTDLPYPAPVFIPE